MSDSPHDLPDVICIYDGGTAGKVEVPTEAFLRFNAWIDEQLGQLESRWYVPRLFGQHRRTSVSNWTPSELDF